MFAHIARAQPTVSPSAAQEDAAASASSQEDASDLCPPSQNLQRAANLLASPPRLYILEYAANTLSLDSELRLTTSVDPEPGGEGKFSEF